ncbi:MAG: hypothetical protein CMJ18_10790 [Phycisphaeraceae bacterium]|nr:hypothetical protein [Phycisphaeraceae bacterium]
MSAVNVKAAMVGFDITPEIHPEFGAWGTTPLVTVLDPECPRLVARCLVLEQDDHRAIWFGSDLCGEPLPFTQSLRQEVADALNVPLEQIIWSTSQAHSTGAIPGSVMCGSHINERVIADPDFIEAQRRRLMSSYVESAREAMSTLRSVRISAGRGFCDSIGYNSRFPMPSGGCKFSRSYAEGLQGGKYYDPTIGVVRFDDLDGHPMGAIFNHGCHPAVLIMCHYCSPDWVGTARTHVEAAIAGAPAMFVQGFCGDVHPRHMFGTPAQARRLGDRLGKAAAEAVSRLTPVRAEPFQTSFDTIEITCQAMPSREECEVEIARRQAFIDDLDADPQATWCCGFNLPDPGLFTAAERAATAQLTIDYFLEALRMIEKGIEPRRTLDVPIGAVRIGDVGAALSPGENFTITGRRVRERSPFAHTLICGDTNGLFGYIGTDDEIDRGGFETDFFWRILEFEGLRLPPAKGSAGRVVEGLTSLLDGLSRDR